MDLKLQSPVVKVPGVGEIVQKKLEKLNIYTVEDLLYHIPYRYEDYRKIFRIRGAPIGEAVSIKAKVKSFANIKSRSGKRMFVADIEDESGRLRAVWFYQPYLISVIQKDAEYLFMGKIDWFGKEKALISPNFQILDENVNLDNLNLIFPVYPETKGITSKWFKTRINNLLKLNPQLIDEFLPDEFTETLSPQNKSLKEIHNPSELESIDSYRSRLAFNELLKLFLINQKRKENWKNYSATQIDTNGSILSSYKKHLPFELTAGQIKVIEEIYKDMTKTVPMNRLLEGDVGSGKTAVAAGACFAAFTAGFQSVIMAPTQILALQHYKTLNEIFKNLQIRISLLSSSVNRETIGKTDIFVGTHALLHRKLDLSDVALVVIDEQHRFGVEQRTHLINTSGKKGKVPHILTMTATPIPRTIAMSLYGDLDLSTLKESPRGRIPPTTWIVPNTKRKGAYGWIEKQISEEHIQVYVICPLIEESESDILKEVKSAKSEFESIKKIFPNLRVGLLHGKLTPKQKEGVINSFAKGKTDILVSTSVVEVGIDVPNATIILIEAAERFGLAQLHQLRGRVGRGSKKSYCLLFTESHSESATQRLGILKSSHSGFELAEMDLKMRGPGEIFGTNQSGFSKLKVARWNDFDLIKSAKDISEKLKTDKKKYEQILRYYFGEKEILN